LATSVATTNQSCTLDFRCSMTLIGSVLSHSSTTTTTTTTTAVSETQID